MGEAAAKMDRAPRGLASLLVRTAASPAKSDAGSDAPRTNMLDVSVERIRANAYQPRREFDAEALAKLASSVKETGLLQPVVLRKSADGYELIAGERRLRAARQAGLETVPAILRDVTEEEMLELALVENVQRENLNALELARAYSLMVRKFGLTQEEVAQRLSVSRPAVTNTIRLLELPESVQEMLAAGKLTAGHARAILSLDGEVARVALAREILERGLSVRDAEERASTADKPAASSRGKAPRPAHIKTLEARLEERLGTKVQIIEGKRKGKILIEFYSNDDFDRIVEIIGSAA